MKLLLLILAALLVVDYRHELYALVDPPQYRLEVHGEVLLLATASCPYCRKMRRFLEMAGVAYAEYDIEQSAEGWRRFRAVEGVGVPVVLVGEEVIHGYDPAAVRKALDRAASPPGREATDSQ